MFPSRLTNQQTDFHENRYGRYATISNKAAVLRWKRHYHSFIHQVVFKLCVVIHLPKICNFRGITGNLTTRYVYHNMAAY